MIFIYIFAAISLITSTLVVFASMLSSRISQDEQFVEVYEYNPPQKQPVSPQPFSLN
jgi:hypothetical protein